MPITDKKTARYNQIVKTKDDKRVHVLAGVLQREGEAEHPDADGLTVAMLAAIHEFGVPEIGIPERSFIRAWFDENQAQILKILRTQFALASVGTITNTQAAQRVAIWAQASIVQRIRAHIPPPLKQATIDRKGSSTPLIASGVLVSAITARAEIV